MRTIEPTAPADDGIVELPAPYDEETMESIIRDVKPMLAATS